MINLNDAVICYPMRAMSFNSSRKDVRPSGRLCSWKKSHPGVAVCSRVKGLRNVTCPCEEPHLTQFAGMLFFQAVLRGARFEAGATALAGTPSRTREFRPAGLRFALLSPIIVGPYRINTTQVLQYNRVFQHSEPATAFLNPTEPCELACVRHQKPMHAEPWAGVGPYALCTFRFAKSAMCDALCPKHRDRPWKP